MSVIEVDPAADPHWQSFLGRPDAGLFHSREWLGVLADTYGLKPRAYVALDESGRAVTALPFCEVSDALGTRVVSLPFTDSCDPLGHGDGGWAQIFARLLAHRAPVSLRFLKFTPSGGDDAPSISKRARWHSLDIDKTVEALWSGMAGATRRAIMKAERSGMTVRALSGPEDLRQFHRLHVGLRKRKYHMLAQPFAFFDAIARRFAAANGWFPLGAFVDGRLAAAVIFLRWSDTLYYKFNASSTEWLDLRPNNLLVWSGMRLAKSIDCRRLDLGPSDDDQPGLIRFKKNFGAEESELRHFRLVPPGWQDQRSDSTRRLLGEMTGLLTRPDVPDEVAAEAGALMYRLFA